MDAAVIAMTSDSRSPPCSAMKDMFLDCDIIAQGQGIGFSVLKTNWIRFGENAWDGVEIMGNMLEPVADLRVLGFHFNIFNNFSAHVFYWLNCRLQVQVRISALGRLFGEGVLGAWKTYHLI